MLKSSFVALFFVLLASSGLPAQQQPSKDKQAAKVKTAKPPKPKRNSAPPHTTRIVSAKKQFMIDTGFPKGRPGYVVDRIIPLQCGGADSPANMQWLTVDEAKLKHRSDRNCRHE
jgi:hypothetical protein